MNTYETPEPIHMRLRVPAGSIDIETDDVSTTTVEITAGGSSDGRAALENVIEELRTRADGATELYVKVPERRGSLVGRRPSYRVHIVAPHGSHLDAGTGSADVRATGRLVGAKVRTGSGSVSLPDVNGDVTIAAVSGDIKLGEVAGRLSLNAVSGDVDVQGVTAEARVTSVSGDLRIDEAGSSVSVKTVSGDIVLGGLTEGEVSLRSVSGDISASVKPGRGVWLDLGSTSGRAVSELDMGDDIGPAPGQKPSIEIRATSVSGDITIRRERARADAGAGVQTGAS
jgi:hypothetical protein